MDNFLRVNNALDVNAMYGKEVYFSLFPNEEKKHFVYKGKLLGYGAYGTNPEYKTFCVYVDRGDGYRFVEYLQDACFKAKEDYEEFKRQRKEERKDSYTVNRLKKILEYEEDYIEVKVKIGDALYPITGITYQAKSIKEPACVLKANAEKGRKWQYE